MDISVLDPSHGGYVSVETQHHQHRRGASISRSPSPTSTNDDVFSVISPNSSQSSLGDSPEETYSCQRKVTGHQLSLHAQRQRSNGGVDLCAALRAAATAQDQQHQHPRRTSASAKRPPPLPRQEERKVLFVNDLVDSATNLVSVIWPLSNVPCPQPGSNRGVLPLRRYIEETLRRSRTSYSTLQVALYYLILLKPHVQRHDSSTQRFANCPTSRAMQCGRRMFLAALILASKYLQDRNYSAKAWSKMSGLQTTEINSNERLFLSAVSWKLHIPDSTFKHWTDIVLRLTLPPTPPAPTSGTMVMDSRTMWARALPLLTPELDDPRLATLSFEDRPQSLSGVRGGLPTPSSSPAPTPTASAFSAITLSQANTPMAETICPRLLESKPDFHPPTPGLMRMATLPTPQMTPSTVGSSTPAASTCSSRRPSMSMAMSQVQNNLFNRINLDRLTASGAPRTSGSFRHPSAAPSMGSCSSPESMISDLTRSSRSSSISSVSTAPTCAPPRAFPARSATARSCGAGWLMNNVTSVKASIGTADHPITILDDTDLTVSPESTSFSKLPFASTPQNPIAPVQLKSRKRSRPQSNTVDEQLQEDVRALLLQHSTDESSPASLTTSPHSTRPSTGFKGPQPPAALRRCESARLPIPREQGKKRVCSSTSIPTASSHVPDIYIEVGESIWQGVS